MEANVRMYRAKIAAGEMTEQEANAILGKSVWEAQGKVPALWPTPRSNDSSESVETLTARSERNYGRNKNGINLTAAIIDAASPEPTRLWPTPTGDDANNATRQSGAYQSLTRVVGKLNPTWVEWLMGFPLGWTDLDVSETP